MQHLEVQPHIRLCKRDITPVVLVVGDPARTEVVAELCDSSVQIANNREYKSIICQKNGAEFLVVSHGVGSPGAAICFEELICLGAKVIIRAGTAGALNKDLKIGQIVICEAAVRDDGASAQYIPKCFPAASDFSVYEKLCETAKEAQVKFRTGYTYTSDAFYKSKFVEEKLELYANSNVSITEMEVATLFVLGKLRGVCTGALCTVDGFPLGDHKEYDPTGELANQGKTKMLEIAVATCVKFAKQLA